jgi:hypothetical protein
MVSSYPRIETRSADNRTFDISEGAAGKSLVTGVCNEALRHVRRDGVFELYDNVPGDAA